ncbi:hypothetical protein V6N11_083447 [Hibiscus sabdariffa]|uniref:Uncharacterized protein n=1 Tax=Hibiscus sabdariffa TaxID=183260 RepID=A0ABR2QM15_9ROSI
MDRAATLELQLEFAKLCIEIAATDDIPSSVVCPKAKAKEAVVLTGGHASGETLNVLGDVSGEPLVGAGESFLEAVYEGAGPARDPRGAESVDPAITGLVENIVHMDEVAKLVDSVEVLGCSVIGSGGAVVGIPNVVESSVLSPNRFDALEVGEGQNVSLKLERVAAGGVAELMNQLKPKAKGGGGKKQK